MQIKDEHLDAFDWAVVHFNDGRTADDFAQEAIDAMGLSFAQSMASEVDTQTLVVVKENPAIQSEVTARLALKVPVVVLKG